MGRCLEATASANGDPEVAVQPGDWKVLVSAVFAWTSAASKRLCPNWRGPPIVPALLKKGKRLQMMLVRRVSHAPRAALSMYFTVS